jgi:hypothetical protein
MKCAIPSSSNLNEKPILQPTLTVCAEIHTAHLSHTALLSQFSLLAEFSILKVTFRDKDSIVSMLVYFNPGLLAFKMGATLIAVRAEIHQALLSQFFLGQDLYIGKLSVKD